MCNSVPLNTPTQHTLLSPSYMPLPPSLTSSPSLCKSLTPLPSPRFRLSALNFLFSHLVYSELFLPLSQSSVYSIFQQPSGNVTQATFLPSPRPPRRPLCCRGLESDYFLGSIQQLCANTLPRQRGNIPKPSDDANTHQHSARHNRCSNTRTLKYSFFPELMACGDY